MKTILCAWLLFLAATVTRGQEGGSLEGTVVDAEGRPVSGLQVLIPAGQRLWLMNGKPQYGAFQGSSADTDAAGRFTLRGPSATSQRVIVLSPDGRMFWPVVPTGTGPDMKITLPEPGTLMVRYDIPGDSAGGKAGAVSHDDEQGYGALDQPQFRAVIDCQQRRRHDADQISCPALIVSGDAGRNEAGHGAETEQQDIEVEGGQTAHADMVRTNGQRIRGKVLGLDKAKASGGNIFVKSGDATGLPWPQRSRNGQNEYKYRTFDVSQFGADGTFETAMLDPGTYTVVADVYPPEDSSLSMPSRNSNPDYVGVAKVTVTADSTPLVSLNLSQANYVDIAGAAADDLTELPIRDLMIQTGKVKPDKPDEIIWDEGFEGARPDGQFLLWDQKEGSAVRFLGAGYVPQTITRQEIIASRRTAKLQVRMKRGEELRGVVLDHAGLPVAHATVYLAPLDLGYVRFGPVMSSGSITNWAHTFATTDQTGHFALRGAAGTQTRVIVVTADGQMVQPVQTEVSDREMQITLPNPATLIVHYDIPGDVAKTDFHLTLHTNGLEQPLWKYVTLKPYGNVSNGGETVMTNLLPGSYNFSRIKYGGAVGHEYAFIYGDPFSFVELDSQKIVLEPGRTQHVNLVRSAGQRVQGQERPGRHYQFGLGRSCTSARQMQSATQMTSKPILWNSATMRCS